MYYIVRTNEPQNSIPVNYAYHTIKEARKELCKRLTDGRSTEGYITEYTNTSVRNERGKRVGRAVVTHYGPEDRKHAFMQVSPDSKRYVLYVNLDSNAKEPHTYYLNKDGTLGKRRY